MNPPYQPRPGKPYSGKRPVRDPLYLKFIRLLPCAACLASRNVDACHTGPHGMAQKSCDRSCVPLCRRCHEQFDADPIRFAERHKLNIPALIEQFNQFYQTKIKREVA
jgi:hypothetical protein